MKTAKFNSSTMTAASGRACDRALVERAFGDMTRFFERLEIDECSMDLSTIMSDGSETSKKFFDQ